MTSKKRGSRGSDRRITPASPAAQGQGPADVRAGRDAAAPSSPAARTSGPADSLHSWRRRGIFHELPPEERAAVQAQFEEVRAALNKTRRLEKELPEGEMKSALRLVNDATEDGLDGRGWQALTWKAGHQGMNARQRRAIAFGLAYVEHARAGRIDDPAPVATVCATFHRNGRPITRDTLCRWKRKYPCDLSEFEPVFSGPADEATPRAKAELQHHAPCLAHGPSRSLIMTKVPSR